MVARYLLPLLRDRHCCGCNAREGEQKVSLLCAHPWPDGESELPLELLECLGSRKEALPRGRLAAAAADHVFAVGGLVAAALCGAQRPAAAAWTPWIPCRCPASREGGWLSDSLAISRLLLSSISRAGPCPMPLADRQRQSGGKLAVAGREIQVAGHKIGG